ncbi:MAG TPA: site-2 protease family protein [Acidimicrobiia bacterium]
MDGKVFCAICWEQDNVRGSVRYLVGGVALATLLALTRSGTALLEWFLWFPPLLFVLVAAHEAGHASAARLLGLRVPLVSVGVGRRVAVFRIGGTRVDLHAVPLSGFAAVGHPGARGLRWRRFLTVAAGPAVNLGLAVGAALGPSIRTTWPGRRSCRRTRHSSAKPWPPRRRHTRPCPGCHA